MATRSQTRIHHFAPFPADATPALISKHSAIHPALFRGVEGKGGGHAAPPDLLSFLLAPPLFYHLLLFLSLLLVLNFFVSRCLRFLHFGLVLFNSFLTCLSSFRFSLAHFHLFTHTHSLCLHIFPLLPAFPFCLLFPLLASSRACYTPPPVAISIPISPPFPSPFSRMHTLSPLYYTTGHTSLSLCSFPSHTTYCQNITRSITLYHTAVTPYRPQPHHTCQNKSLYS